LQLGGFGRPIRVWQGYSHGTITVCGWRQ
jgi:hypothetical protein